LDVLNCDDIKKWLAAILQSMSEKIEKRPMKREYTKRIQSVYKDGNKVVLGSVARLCRRNVAGQTYWPYTTGYQKVTLDSLQFMIART
jgi:predicted ATPase